MRAQEPANVTLHSLRVALLYRGLQAGFITLIAFTIFGERKYFSKIPATASYYVYASVCRRSPKSSAHARRDVTPPTALS